MIVHVVQQGDTVISIANQYGVSAQRMILDNGLQESAELVQGQTIVIVYPKQTYTVQEGDTLQKIADENNIDVLQLLRNNPYLSDREYIYPGETLVISYDNNKGKITTNGYANTFIEDNTLTRTLPFLSYLSIFGYRTTNEGDIIGIEDKDIINLARDYHVAPIMIVSSFTEQGGVHPEVNRFLYNESYVNRHIDNIIRTLERKGYYGVNVTYQYINEDNRSVYESYTKKLSERLKQEGYLLLITISEKFIINADKVTFEKIDYTNISQMVDGFTLLNYNWGYSYGPPGPVVSVFLMKQFIDHIVKMIPPEKIEIGIPIIGYDWELPYIIGVTKASSLTLSSAVALAGNAGVAILFDEVSQSPYFEYIDNRSGVPRRHVVWFIDARTINAILDMVSEYGFKGTGIWNIMNYYAQNWLIMNSEYKIETLLT